MAELAGFFVNLGFKIDKDSQARFNASVADAGRKIASFGTAAAAAGVAMGAAWLSSTKALSREFNAAKFANSSISGMKSLGMAIDAVGGNAQAAEAALPDMPHR